MADDDDWDDMNSPYEDGHWIWDEKLKSIAFVSHSVGLEDADVMEVLAGDVTEFKELDLIEQENYKKRFQRKVLPGKPDVICLQDVKDYALYTAPVSLLSSDLINLLHVHTVDRFLRALILYCQYYLQLVDIMAIRMKELEKKVRTPASDEVEEMYRKNLGDLRAVLANEYSGILLGSGGTKYFHHMGTRKQKVRSMTGKDKRLFEAFIRMSIQIVWLALSRRNFPKLLMEVNRLFKSDTFNNVEHKQKTNYLQQMTPMERNVFLGNCLQSKPTKSCVNSPLTNEAFCNRHIDYKLYGLGTIKYDALPTRLASIRGWLVVPEEQFCDQNISLGILGINRNQFDATLQEIPVPTNPSDASVSIKSAKTSSSRSGSRMSNKKQKTNIKTYVYEDIYLPTEESEMRSLPTSFPDTPSDKHYNKYAKQRIMWQNRLQFLLRRRYSSIWK